MGVDCRDTDGNGVCADIRDSYRLLRDINLYRTSGDTEEQSIWTLKGQVTTGTSHPIGAEAAAPPPLAQNPPSRA